MANSTHKAEFYIVFDAVVYSGHSSSAWVSKVRAAKVSKGKPNLKGGEIALKFAVNIPDAAFLRLIPDVAINIPDGFWTSQPMEVTVCEPDEAEATS